jgi:hypothetical protein
MTERQRPMSKGCVIDISIYAQIGSSPVSV